MNLSQAKKIGVEALIQGKPRAPALNQGFIKAACESDASTADLLNGYIDGWAIAMLAENAIPGAPSIAELATIEAA